MRRRRRKEKKRKCQLSLSKSHKSKKGIKMIGRKLRKSIKSARSRLQEAQNDHINHIVFKSAHKNINVHTLTLYYCCMTLNYVQKQFKFIYYVVVFFYYNNCVQIIFAAYNNVFLSNWDAFRNNCGTVLPH